MWPAQIPWPCQLHSSVLMSTDHASTHWSRNQANLQPLSCTETHLAKCKDWFSKPHTQVCKSSKAHLDPFHTLSLLCRGQLRMNFLPRINRVMMPAFTPGQVVPRIHRRALPEARLHLHQEPAENTKCGSHQCYSPNIICSPPSGHMTVLPFLSHCIRM